MVAIIILILSWFFIIFGMVAIFSLKNMYARILSSTTIDTVASFLVLFALMFVSGSFIFIVRFIILIIFLLITNPISSHVNIRSAYLSGIPIKEEGESK
ncbi:MAG: cation:proton antiporter [Tenericutes bacterium GWC2_34_14]|nr:MAG: cation:proton antiporter [Tenericutes bacterium GWA2_35_7]OHE30077.1 MAG: cation:proton antiporter [Tenericutes bacterium GWC2_34_14]OHE35057.1 MAG: cation:proton antiporter [Tenericutes bacterium GWE2_34_108]OHE37486.1 MAG: cation:proton antiporter [Tenericutes bacterium GWF1_35_14]OHE39783.1 MAG: cation:proton antiporter [Tenericutes bacterium GWF2_35_184]OHE42580.1 MAG: cation:proton antiporter [Tenericutes bacterium RIFOXYA12_FULL_35_10]OHE44431.1 MAG: cation:proton antiporter [Te